MGSCEMEFVIGPAAVRMYFNEGEGTYDIYKAVEGENSGDVQSYVVGIVSSPLHALKLFNVAVEELTTAWHLNRTR